jgi:hypothetical protein
MNLDSGKGVVVIAPLYLEQRNCCEGGFGNVTRIVAQHERDMDNLAVRLTITMIP